MTNVAVDTDAVHKLLVYGLIDEAKVALGSTLPQFHCLGASKYVVRRLITDGNFHKSREDLESEFKRVLSCITLIEPTAEEVELAARLESIAQQSGNSLDVGESQLCAVLATRHLDLIVTGDKRAIVAAENLYQIDSEYSFLSSKFASIEQVFLNMIKIHDLEKLKSSVCLESGIDKSLSTCFSCTSKIINSDSTIEGLKSYVNNLKSRAASVLNDLSS